MPKYHENGKTIDRYTAEEIKKLPSKTDEGHANSISDKELTANALSDPDNPPLDAAFFDRAKKIRLEDYMRSNKEKVCLRLDREVISWFRARGSGYQTKINAALRAFIDNQEHRL